MSAGRKVLGMLPLGAAVYSVYQVYKDRGLDGFLNDLQSVTYEGLMGRISDVGVGLAALLGAKMVSNYAPVGVPRTLVRTAMVYFGMNKLVTAIQQGANYGGRGGRGWISSSNYVPVNNYSEVNRYQPVVE